MIPYLRIENLKNHTLSGGTYLYSPYMGVPPPGRDWGAGGGEVGVVNSGASTACDGLAAGI